jgi:phosphoenolpyruvate carboxykinase (ATP)
MNVFKIAAQKIYEQAGKDNRLIEGLSLNELKQLALENHEVILTKFGSIAADSEPMNRSAPHTRNSEDDPFGQEESRLADKSADFLSREQIISLDTIVGDGKDGISARFIIPRQHAHIAYGLKLLFDAPAPRIVKEPTYTIIYFTDESFDQNKGRKLLDKDITVRLMMGQRRGEQVKICRNTVYLGEGKKGIFHFENWRVKAIDKTGLFLHAGARRDKLWLYNPTGKTEMIRESVTAVSGLTATGKTTTLCRSLSEKHGEFSEMIGDDGGAVGFDGSYAAFEMGGLYVKTEGLDETQPEILRAVEAEDAYLENVTLAKDSFTPDFKDIKKTGNGRAIITRDNLRLAAKSLGAERLNHIIILTRNPLVNVISALTPEQATMQFIYGESIESTGGNPEDAGKFKREIFLDPFLTGNRLEHAMIFYEILCRNRINCYLANTGTIGYANSKVTLEQSLAVYHDLLRSQMVFSSDTDHLGYRYPVRCERSDPQKLAAFHLFPDKVQLREIMIDFLRGRERFLEEFEGKYGKIPDHIRNSLPWQLAK